MDSISVKGQELGINEVVDSLVNALKFVDVVESQLKDGFQITDLIAISMQYSLLLDIYNDRKLFAAQFLDLSADEAKEVVSQVAEQTGKEQGVVMQKAVPALRIAARAYGLIDYAIKEVSVIAEEAKELVKK